MYTDQDWLDAQKTLDDTARAREIANMHVWESCMGRKPEADTLRVARALLRMENNLICTYTGLTLHTREAVARILRYTAAHPAKDLPEKWEEARNED